MKRSLAIVVLNHTHFQEAACAEWTSNRGTQQSTLKPKVKDSGQWLLRDSQTVEHWKNRVFFCINVNFLRSQCKIETAEWATTYLLLCDVICLASEPLRPNRRRGEMGRPFLRNAQWMWSGWRNSAKQQQRRTAKLTSLSELPLRPSWKLATFIWDEANNHGQLWYKFVGQGNVRLFKWHYEDITLYRIDIGG